MREKQQSPTIFTKYVHVSYRLTSGVTTDPADPAMRGGARGPMGAQNCGISFCHWKFNSNFRADVRCHEQMKPSVEWSSCIVDLLLDLDV